MILAVTWFDGYDTSKPSQERMIRKKGVAAMEHREVAIATDALPESEQSCLIPGRL